MRTVASLRMAMCGPRNAGLMRDSASNRPAKHLWRLHHDIAIEEGSGTPYADLGHPDAEDVLVKAGLAHEIVQIIKSRYLTQKRAAEQPGMLQPKLSDLLRGKFRGISQTKMIECLNRLGRDVNIEGRKAASTR